MFRYLTVLTVLLILLGLNALIALSWGQFHIALSEIWPVLSGRSADEMLTNIIFNLRLPRIAAAILVGAALAAAGTVFQGIFRNPLVSPDLLGVSGGACVGAATSILLGVGIFGIQAASFLGGLIAVIMTMTLPKLVRQDSNIILVLSGIIISGFMGACLGLLKYIADPETELAEIVYWQLGSLARAEPANLMVLTPIVLITLGVLFAMRWRINLLSLGELEAKLAGANVRLERNIMVVCATLLTASAVCISGTIGWVGLVVPHLARMFVGDNNLRTFPISIITGSLFLLLIDTLARNLYQQEIPLSILSGFIGAPFFAWVLVKQRVVD